MLFFLHCQVPCSFYSATVIIWKEKPSRQFNCHNSKACKLGPWVCKCVIQPFKFPLRRFSCLEIVYIMDIGTWRVYGWNTCICFKHPSLTKPFSDCFRTELANWLVVFQNAVLLLYTKLMHKENASTLNPWKNKNGIQMRQYGSTAWADSILFEWLCILA